jgi:DNA repair photolyase
MDLLKPALLPDNFTRSLYKVAPYQGCAHGCRYCDGRAERYYVEGDFEKDIVARRGIPERMCADLPKVRERGMVAFGSGTTDPYQPCEAKAPITGTCAELLADHRQLPAMVMTKSTLALRDLPLWKRVNDSSGFVLMVSLTSLDEELRSVMEPGAPSFAERLDLLKRFKEAGCAVGILAMPFLPGLSDSQDSIARLYAAAKEVGVDFVMPGGLTLRPGRQKALYLATLAQKHPEVLEATERLFADERPSGWPGRAATMTLNATIAPIRKEAGIPWLLPHRILARILPPHDSFRILLRDMVELYGERGIDTASLRHAADVYDSWLTDKRHGFRRSRKLPAEWLEAILPAALQSGELARTLDNPKLSDFAASVILDGARLNYLSLKLE